MTTEVLRNMLYAGSPGSWPTSARRDGRDPLPGRPVPRRGLGRGDPAPARPSRLVGLSATVSNAEEFGDWLAEVRGDTAVVVDEHRPVPLWQHMLVGSPAVRHVRRVADDADGRRARRSTPRWSADDRPRERQTPAGDRGRAAARGGRDARLPAAGAGRRHRPARRGRAAAGDHVHLLPRRLRRRGRPVRARRPAVDHRTGATRSGDRRPAHRRPARSRPRRAGLLGVAGRPGARHRRPPRRPAAGVQGDGRGAVRPRPGAGRCSPPRRWRWASTCPPAPWCWSSS